MVAVLSRLGVQLQYPPEQTCCGQPAYNSGYRREAASAASRFIELFRDAPAIVCPSGSCVHMVRHHYPTLFPDDPAMREQALQIGRKTYEFTEYLVDVLGITNAGTQIGSRHTGTVTYHDSCHLARGLGIRRQPRLLLETMPGLVLSEMAESDRCCGFGGTFSVNYADISAALAEEKADNALAAGADTLTGCDVSCLMNIRGILSRRKQPMRVLHIAEILDPTRPAVSPETNRELSTSTTKKVLR